MEKSDSSIEGEGGTSNSKITTVATTNVTIAAAMQSVCNDGRGNRVGSRAKRRQKKSQHPSWLRNTGSNVSNVVPSQPVAELC